MSWFKSWWSKPVKSEDVPTKECVTGLEFLSDEELLGISLLLQSIDYDMAPSYNKNSAVWHGVRLIGRKLKFELMTRQIEEDARIDWSCEDETEDKK